MIITELPLDPVGQTGMSQWLNHVIETRYFCGFSDMGHLGPQLTMVPTRVVPQISECAWEPLFSRLPECEPAGTTMGATMSQSGSQWFRMAGHRKIAVYRMITGVRFRPVVPGAISGASDDGRTCTGIHGVQNIPDFTAENLQFLKSFIGPVGKNEKVVNGSGNAWLELMPQPSYGLMRI